MQPQTQLFGSATVLPRLRPDLVISRQTYRGQTAYVIKDPVSLRYYRLGTQELFLAGLLDGERTLGEVTARMEKEFPGTGITEEHVVQLLTMFAHMSYLQLAGEPAYRMFGTLRDARNKYRWLGHVLSVAGVLMYFKVTLCDPDLLLLKMEKRLRFLWSKKTAWAVAGLTCVAVVMVLSNLDRFRERLPDFLTIHNLILLWLTLVGVKVFHEFGHGLMCKHYGGEVHQMGAMLILLTPFLFCDATDSWMFRNKWHKIAVNMGGMLVELVLASCAAILWAVTQPGLLNQLAFNAMVVCSFTTLVFNANPLMKFDGYYVLADFLEIPNLRDRARQAITGLMMRWFTGRPEGRPTDISRRGRTIFIAYAVCSYLYMWYIIFRIFRIIGLKLQPYGLENLGRGLIVIAYVAGIAFPLWALGRQLVVRLKNDPTEVVGGRWPKLCAGAAAILLVMAICPWPLYVTSSCLLNGTNRVDVTAKSPGFLREILVDEGAHVQKGQTIARLENDELRNRRLDAEDELHITGLRVQSAMARNSATFVARYNTLESEQLAALDTLVTNVAGLELKAPVAGTVLTSDLQTRRGTYLRDGDGFCEILPEGKINVIVALSESEAGLVRVGQPLEFRLYSLPGKPFYGKVTKTFVARTEELQNSVLAARFGGDVPTQIGLSGHEEPTEPLYEAELQIENSGNFLRPGMSGRARIHCGRTTPLHVVVSHIRAMLRLE